jgi:hypothetical protein
MTAETLSAEEREALFGRAEFRLHQFDAPVKFAERWPDIYAGYHLEAARERANDFRELLRLAKLATPELIALGEAAVAWNRSEKFRGDSVMTDEARGEMCRLARTYAASVAEVKHG